MIISTKFVTKLCFPDDKCKAMKDTDVFLLYACVFVIVNRKFTGAAPDDCTDQ